MDDWVALNLEPKVFGLTSQVPIKPLANKTVLLGTKDMTVNAAAAKKLAEKYSGVDLKCYG